MKKKRKTENKKEDEPHNVNVSEGYESAEMLTVSKTEGSSEWILDSGCSFHMTPNRQWFQDFETIKGGKVLLGNNQECCVEGIGSIQVKMFDGQT